MLSVIPTSNLPFTFIEVLQNFTNTLDNFPAKPEHAFTNKTVNETVFYLSINSTSYHPTLFFPEIETSMRDKF